MPHRVGGTTTRRVFYGTIEKADRSRPTPLPPRYRQKCLRNVPHTWRFDSVLCPIVGWAAVLRLFASLSSAPLSFPFYFLFFSLPCPLLSFLVCVVVLSSRFQVVETFFVAPCGPVVGSDSGRTMRGVFAAATRRDVCFASLLELTDAVAARWITEPVNFSLLVFGTPKNHAGGHARSAADAESSGAGGGETKVTAPRCLPRIVRPGGVGFFLFLGGGFVFAGAPAVAASVPDGGGDEWPCSFRLALTHFPLLSLFLSLPLSCLLVKGDASEAAGAGAALAGSRQVRGSRLFSFLFLFPCTFAPCLSPGVGGFCWRVATFGGVCRWLLFCACSRLGFSDRRLLVS